MNFIQSTNCRTELAIYSPVTYHGAVNIAEEEAAERRTVVSNSVNVRILDITFHHQIFSIGSDDVASDNVTTTRNARIDTATEVNWMTESWLNQ